MLYYSEEEWTARGIDSKFHRLFVLLWSEQLSAGTYDGWQVRMMNLQSLLKEVVTVAELSSRYEPYRHNLGHVIEEAKAVAKRDPIVCKYFPFVDRTLGRFLLGTKDVNLSNVEATASLLLGHMEAYEQRLIDEVREMLSQPEKRSDQELSNVVMALGTHLGSSGYSMEYLGDCREILEQPTEPSFLLRFNELMARLDKKSRDYTCLFPISGISGSEHMPGLALRKAVSVEDAAVRAWRERTGSADGRELDVNVFAEVRVTAMDPYVAVRNGYAKIAGIFAATRLYLPRAHLGIHGDSALVRYEDGTYRRIRHASQLDYVRNSTSPRNRTAGLLRLLTRLQEGDREQLRTALEYHRLALATVDPVAQIVNMWAAMEVLFIHGSGTIIERIARHVPCTIALNNVHKQLTSLAIYLRTLSHSNDRLAELLLIGETGRVEPEALLLLLIDDDTSRAEQLMELCAVNLLVHHRVEGIRAKLQDEEISDRIGAYRQNIEWQLRRIYRARNEAMHHGRLPERSSPLVQHLHSYLATSIHRLIHFLSGHPEWSIADTFVHEKLLYDDYVHALGVLNKKKGRSNKKNNRSRNVAGAMAKTDDMAKLFLNPEQALPSLRLTSENRGLKSELLSSRSQRGGSDETSPGNETRGEAAGTPRDAGGSTTQGA